MYKQMAEQYRHGYAPGKTSGTGKDGSFCQGFEKTDCKKAKTACTWQEKTAKVSAHCKRNIKTHWEPSARELEALEAMEEARRQAQRASYKATNGGAGGACKEKKAPCEPDCANANKAAGTCRAKSGQGVNYKGPKSAASPVVAAPRAAVAAAAANNSAPKFSRAYAPGKAVGTGKDGSFCQGFDERDCGKAKTACAWQPATKDRSAFCHRRIKTQADMNVLRPFNSKGMAYSQEGGDEEYYSDEELDNELSTSSAYTPVEYGGEQLYLERKRVGSDVYENEGDDFYLVGKVKSLNPLEIKLNKK